jgi:putative NIF3 family GTP cyclohydrolase 1 type 2
VRVRRRASEVARVFQEICPLGSGIEKDEEGFVFGDPDRMISRIGCLWSVDGASLKRCLAHGLEMVFCHESIWLPVWNSQWYTAPSASEVTPHKLRRELLERGGLVVYRCHSGWDALPQDGVSDQAVAALGLPGLRTVAREKFFSVVEMPEPIEISNLARLVSEGLGFPGVRTYGDARKCVRRFSFLIGGFGENQFHMPQAAHALGAEAIVMGEMTEPIVLAALDMGMPVIESLHSVSEIPALRRQAELLGERLPGMHVEYVPSGAAAYGLPL